MGCSSNRQGGFTPDNDRDADWFSDQIWNKLNNDNKNKNFRLFIK